MLKGAATCFYAFVGFDVIAISSEEAKNPSRDIPLAIMLTLLLSFLVYTGTSLILTLIVPYYEISASAPLAGAFLAKGSYMVTYLVAVGSMVALTASMLGCLFPIPRLTFAMARDGLLCPMFAHVHPTTKVPILNCIVAGSLTALTALFLSLEQLVEMMSIGTLLAYTLVAASVILLRYKPIDEQRNLLDESFDEKGATNQKKDTTDASMELHNLVKKDLTEKERLVGPREPTGASYHKVAKFTFIFAVTSFLLSAFLTYGVVSRLLPTWMKIIPVFIFAIMLVLMTVVIAKQPQSTEELPFKVPFVPILPLLSISCDIHLMMQLSPATWIRFGLWLILGEYNYVQCWITMIQKAKEASA